MRDGRNDTRYQCVILRLDNFHYEVVESDNVNNHPIILLAILTQNNAHVILCDNHCYNMVAITCVLYYSIYPKIACRNTIAM